MKRTTRATCAAAVAATLLAATPAAIGASGPKIVTGLNGPRGVAMGPGGKLVVAQANGVVSQVIRNGPRAGAVKRVVKVPKQALAPAVSIGNDRHHTTWILTAGAAKVTEGAGTLYSYTAKQGRRMVLNVQRWQRRNPDRFDLESKPKESNPFGVAGLRDGSALVVDAANNSLIRVRPNGRAYPVARVMPRTVTMPPGITGPGLPPAGTPIASEAVITSVTVGADGAYYIGELRDFPATPGTSQIWRIRPNARNAVCNPKTPQRGPCTRYADGFTSIMDLDAGRGNRIYVVEMSKMSWLAVEGQVPGSEIGALIRVGHDRAVRTELKPGQLVLPGGVAVGKSGVAFVASPFLGPGTLQQVK